MQILQKRQPSGRADALAGFMVTVDAKPFQVGAVTYYHNHSLHSQPITSHPKFLEARKTSGNRGRSFIAIVVAPSNIDNFTDIQLGEVESTEGKQTLSADFGVGWVTQYNYRRSTLSAVAASLRALLTHRLYYSDLTQAESYRCRGSSVHAINLLSEQPRRLDY